VKRVLPWILGVLMLTAVLVVGLSQAGGGDEQEAAAQPFDLDAALVALEGSPEPLAGLHDQSSELLEGGVPAFDARMKELRGTPVVINKWASWCGPCRAEFPVFQRVATERGKEIAFLGSNSHDSLDPARDFLAEYPIPFPSYRDPDEKIAQAIGAPANYPVTVFVDAKGKTAFIHQGPYESDRDLNADIDRYLAS
jgi:thiol-disulfide isomerase/thioredoxin